MADDTYYFETYEETGTPVIRLRSTDNSFEIFMDCMTKIELNDFTPYPKNPLLAKFFVNIGYADALGSGVRNLYKFTKIYSGGEPDFEEGDVFRLMVPLQDTISNKKENGLSERQNKILTMIRSNASIQRDDIAESLNMSVRTVQREIQEIKKTIKIGYNKKTKQWNFPN